MEFSRREDVMSQIRKQLPFLVLEGKPLDWRDFASRVPWGQVLANLVLIFLLKKQWERYKTDKTWEALANTEKTNPLKVKGWVTT